MSHCTPPGSLVEQWQDELKDKFGIDPIDLFGGAVTKRKSLQRKRSFVVQGLKFHQMVIEITMPSGGK